MDELIDRALKSYASREPSPSLESRILARTREPRRRTPWVLALAAFAAASLVLTLLPHHPVAPALPQSGTGFQPVHDIDSQPEATRIPTRPHHRHRRPLQPKLAVFPTPAPIPDIEIALAHALSADPELAASLLAIPAPIEPQPITIEPLSIKSLDED